MVRLLSRLIGYWLVAAALVAGVVDGARSIAASAPVLTSLAELRGRLASVEAAAPAPDLAWPLDQAFAFVMAAPAAAVLAAAGFLFLAAGRKRRPAAFGREIAV